MQNLVVALTAIFVLGVGAQWTAWLLRLPSILLLLAVGFLVGPVTRLLDPTALIGDLLFPIVSLSVALIMFEGGLTLKWGELRAVGSVLLPLLTVGVAVTWALAAVAASFLIGMSLPVALLQGAILTVTGPTVIGPLLREIRPVGRVGSIAKWEGIVVDPIGAILAVLVFETVEEAMQGDLWETAMVSIAGPLESLALGVVLGATVAGLLVWGLSQFVIPDHLQSPIVLAAVLGAFTASNAVHDESGLVTVTVMGLVMANQHFASVRHIIEFKENLRVLLIGGLFILLSARLRLEEFASVGWGNLAFVAWIILVVRPAAVFLSTWRSSLTWQERVFLAWFAPRGIVAAAVSSVFALRLGGDAGGLVETTFLVVASTVAIYGLSSAWLARKLGLASSNPQGILFVGANDFARQLAAAVKGAGFPVLLIDSNWNNAQAARMEDLPSHTASALSEALVDDLDFGGLGRMLALTSNEEVNALATQQFAELFGRGEVYQLVPKSEDRERTKTASHLRRGRLLFGPGITFAELSSRSAAGWRIRGTKLTEEFGLKQLQERDGERSIPLLLLTPQGTLKVSTVDSPLAPAPGETLMMLSPPREMAAGN